jgi:hypothetical protein
VELSPLPAARVGHAFLGLTTAVAGVGVWLDRLGPKPLSPAVAVLLVGLGAVIAVRSLRMGVDCRNGVVEVRGLFFTRRVPRVRIDHVTGFPALRWRDDAGRCRWTPIVFLIDSPGTLSHVRRHNTEDLDRLRTWIGRGNR